MSDDRSRLREKACVRGAFMVLLAASTLLWAEKRPFTVADDIALTYLGEPFLEGAEAITYSPDGKYLVVQAERGRLDNNRTESMLRVYSVSAIESYLAGPPGSAEPAPYWSFSRSIYRDGPQITKLKWLPNSKGFGFLSKSQTGTESLFLADLRSKRLTALSRDGEDVSAFDIHDGRNFVYTALSPAVRKTIEGDSDAVSIVGTDRKLADLFSPGTSSHWHDWSQLWTVVGGRRTLVLDPLTHRPLPIHWMGELALSLSPTGDKVLTALTVPSIPSTWPLLYPPPPTTAVEITAGTQDPEIADGWFQVSRYVLVDLGKNTVTWLPFGPIGYEAGWIGLPDSGWSEDGRWVAMTNAFLDRETSSSAPARPYAVVFDVRETSYSTVEPVFGNKAGGVYEDGYHLVTRIRFEPGSSDAVKLDYQNPGGGASSRTYHRTPSGWTPKPGDPPPASPSIKIAVQQDLNHSPVLSASDTRRNISRVIWDPNPWLKEVQLGDVSVFRWKDKTGRDLIGGLFKPPDYEPSKRYPLVIQNHGFSTTEFIPSGIYPQGFAARELAAAGFLVLQVRGCPIRHTFEEGPCQVEAYESAVDRLVSEGQVDPDRIGIVGFSRTCYYVLEAITTGKVHYRAASITDGMDMGYLQFLLSDKAAEPDMTHIIGSAPFGDGLKQWLAHSPEFNMDKVQTPLLVVGVGKIGILAEWEPYSALWHLEKPVDLILLKEGTHPLSNPKQRMVSQGSTVDWMRFWLKGEEDPDPSKHDQYVRWRKLRDLSH